MKRRSILKVAGTGALTGLAGCLGNSGSGSGGTVKIAIITTLSGPFAHYGEFTMTGTEYAVQEVNDSDKVLPDTTLEIKSYDSATDPETALSVAREATTQWNADIIAGPVISSVANSVAGFAADRNIPFVFTSRDRSLTTGKNCAPTTYRPGVCHTQSLAGGVARWAVNNIGPNGFVLYQNYSYGQSNNQWTATYAEQEGGQVVDSIGLPIDQSDFSSALSEISSQDPDWVFNTFFGGSMTAFLNQAANRGFDVPLMTAGIDGKLLAETGQETYDTLPGLYNFEQWSPAVDTERANHFRDAILEETGGYPIEYMVAPYHNIKFVADVLHANDGSADTDRFRQATEQDGGFSYNGLYEEDVRVRACDHQALLPLFNNKWTGVDTKIPWATYDLQTTIDTANVIPSCSDAECSF